MKDRILESYLASFVDERNLSDLDESDAFERFANFCIVSREHPGDFDFEDISVGGNGDSAIDGLAILVNEHLVSSTEEIDYFKNNLRRLDVQFLFIQSKTSGKFEVSEIGNFLFGIRSFFEREPLTKENKEIQRLRHLKDYIYRSTIDMDTNPLCRMYYVTSGKWIEDVNLRGRISKGVNELKSTNLFSDVKFFPIDAERLGTIYRELKRKVVREVTFDKYTILPQIDNVQEAYIGILPSTEYLKLICDEEGNLLRTLFYDNVRDFQGNNPVNMEIQETLAESTQSDKFALLNNGITVVAQSVNKVGTTFKIKDFQIVNGCQTSHILYRSRNILNERILIPIKLVVTSDPDVTNLVIKATNRQTEVKLEAFESLREFQKKLEEFYTGFGKNNTPRLYYERRSKQYDHLPIPQEHIVTLAAQVKCFLAMFLNEPHSTHRYYGELLNVNRSRMFADNHLPYPYYISGFALCILEEFFAQSRIQYVYKKFKYQMLMLLRLQSERFPMPYLNAKKKMDDYCSDLLSVLSDKEAALKALTATTSVIQTALDTGKYEPREALRLKAFTSYLISQVTSPSKTSPATVSRQVGKVIKFSDIKGFGFIKPQTGDDLFVHYSDIRVTGFRTLRQGQSVEFTVLESEKGFQAKDVLTLD